LHDFRSLVNGAVLVLVVLFLPKGIWEPRRVRAWWNRRSAA
jgi:branched-chain amino acid transport system permease protein